MDKSTSTLRSGWRRLVGAWHALSPAQRDGALYLLATLFTLAALIGSSIVLYRQWAALALAPYAVAVVASFGVHFWSRHSGTKRATFAPRVAIASLVFVGAVVVPLSLEIAWRSDGATALHVQPEAPVIERAGTFIANFKDPYRFVDPTNAHDLVGNRPASEAFFPYLPAMAIFGLPAGLAESSRFTDARIFFLLATSLIGLGALLIARAPKERRLRAAQFLLVLPLASLPLATGGDDLPIVAILLAGLVLADRDRDGLAGFFFGLAAAMKFTAWPLALIVMVFLSFARGSVRAARMWTGFVVVVVPFVLPYAIVNVRAFVENVVLFPLGMAGISSPAASPLPGHMIVSAVPSLHRALPITAAAIGIAVLYLFLRKHRPSTPAQLSTLAGWIMLYAICVAPATRVGYLLYPINFFVWGWMLDRTSDRDTSAPTVDPAQIGALLPR